MSEIIVEQNLKARLNVGVIYPRLEELTVIPSIEKQIIYPEGDGFSKVEVDEVTSNIDKNIIAENIKSGIEILGVIGSIEFDDFDDYDRCENIVSEILGK